MLSTFSDDWVTRQENGEEEEEESPRKEGKNDT